MYVPPHFASRDEELAVEIIARYGFSTLVTVDDEGPFASHVPLLFDRPTRRLIGHVARANPQWQHFARGPVLAIFHGPHAYVSPASYAPRPDNVPTWNYVVVHARGRATLLEPGAPTLAVVERLTAQYEPAVGGATAPDPDAALRLSRAIVAFEIALDRIDTKLKLSQNRPAHDHAEVSRQLSESEDAAARDVAAWMTRLRP